MAVRRFGVARRRARRGRPGPWVVLLPSLAAAQFRGFVDAEIAPRCPDGLTLATGQGQFRGADGRMVSERAHC